MKFLVLLICLMPSCVLAWGLDIPKTKVRDLTFEVAQIGEKRFHYMSEYDKKWTYGLALDWNVDIGKYLYWDNRIYADGINSQIKHFGWQYEQGIRLYNNKIQLFYRHHSEHAAEDVYLSRFPIDNRVGLKINFTN